MIFRQINRKDCKVLALRNLGTTPIYTYEYVVFEVNDEHISVGTKMLVGYNLKSICIFKRK